MPRTAEEEMERAWGCIAATAGIGCIIVIVLLYEAVQWLSSLL